MKIFLQLVSCFLAVYAASLVDSNLMEWEEFKATFGKTYETQQEEEFRMKVFMENRNSIAEHNAKYKRGEEIFEMDVNKFSDMPHDEFEKFYTGFKYSINSDIKTHETTFDIPDDSSLPDYVNWVEKGAVTPVKNQGRCGSGYAFSATGSMEGQHFIKTGNLVSLSEENLIDCTHAYSNYGCRGGHVDTCFVYVTYNKGIDTEASYPYVGRDFQPCRYNTTAVGATFCSHVNLPRDNETSLQIAVANVGPVSVYVTVTKKFVHYKSGVFRDPSCTRPFPKHGVLAVGYGIDNETQEPYWLVKNSWGEDWGENGYVRIARNADNMCWIAKYATYPVVNCS